MNNPYEAGEVSDQNQRTQRDHVVLAVMSASWASFKLASIITIPAAIILFVTYGARSSLFATAFVYSVWVGTAMIVVAMRAIRRQQKQC